jgi:hypothetical protein
VGNVVVSAYRTSNRFFHHDLNSGRRWEFSLTPTVYKPYVWPKKRFKPEAEEMELLRKWANRHTWVGRIVALDTLHYAAAFGTADESGESATQQYVVARTDGKQVYATGSTPVYLNFADSTRVFGSHMDDEGNFDVWIFRKPAL